MTAPDDTTETHLRIQLVIPPGAPTKGPATVRLRIDEVSYADRAAQTVAACDVTVGPGVPVVGPFALVAPLQKGCTYAVRVHVDHSGSGTIDAGDLLTTELQEVRPQDDMTLTRIRVTSI